MPRGLCATPKESDLRDLTASQHGTIEVVNMIDIRLYQKEFLNNMIALDKVG